MYNHVADLGALANDVGFGIANSHAQRIRETLLRLNAEVTGHRLLRGAVTPGRVRVQALPDPERLAAIAADVDELAELTLRHSIVRDRFTGTAVLNTQQAQEIGCLGYVARASGLPARRPPRVRSRRHPHNLQQRRRPCPLPDPPRRVRPVRRSHRAAPRRDRTPCRLRRTAPALEGKRQRRRHRRGLARHHRHPRRDRRRRPAQPGQARRPVMVQLAGAPRGASPRPSFPTSRW